MAMCHSSSCRLRIRISEDKSRDATTYYTFNYAAISPIPWLVVFWRGLLELDLAILCILL